MADMELYASIGQKGLCLLHREKEDIPWELGISCPVMFGASNCPQLQAPLPSAAQGSGTARVLPGSVLPGAGSGSHGQVWGVSIPPAESVCSMGIGGCGGVWSIPWTWFCLTPLHQLLPVLLALRAPQNQLPALSSPNLNLPSALHNQPALSFPNLNLPSAPQV